MTKTQENPLRKVAILVASLVEQDADQVLASLPPSTALRVQELVEQLTDIDPEEQEAIVADFRQSLSAANAASRRTEVQDSDDVVFEISRESLQAEAANYRPYSYESHRPFQSLSAADTEFIVSMLLCEHPQTIALVLSRLDAERAALVLARLPEQEQADILTRLGELDAIDEQTVQVVEAQVAQWIAQENQRVRRLTAGRELVERILSHIAPRDRNRLANQMPRSERNDLPLSDLARKPLQLEIPPRVVQSRVSRSRFGAERGITSAVESHDAVAMPSTPTPSTVTRSIRAPEEPNPFVSYTAEQCNFALEQIDPELLQSALAECDPAVVTLAMFGASSQVLRRVLKGVARDAARRFRRSLRDVGPVRLSDIHTAQQRVLFAIHKLRG